VVIPLAVAEGWTAVLAGLIPIVGLGGIGYVVVRAARDPGDERDHGEDE